MLSLIILSITLVLTGCMSSGNASVMDQDRVAQITVDVSKKEDVRRILGQPNTITKQSGSYPALPGFPTLPNSEMWSYQHVKIDVNGATFIPIVGLFAGGSTSSINTFTVVFDGQGIARYISSSQSEGRSGMGSSSTPAPATDSPAPIKAWKK